MSNLHYPFEPVAHEDWVLQIQKELRDQAGKIEFKDAIEELALTITDSPKSILAISSPTDSSHVNNVHYERVTNEKESNRRILLALMQGADALFICCEGNGIDWTIVLNEVELAYIRTEILVNNDAQLAELKEQLSIEQLNHLILLKDEFNPDKNASCHSYFNGFESHQIGANAQEELSLITTAYHRYLSEGNRSDVVFSIGIGANYFVQIAKIRALHYLINKIGNLHGVSHPSYRIQAHIGWVNKSLKDPYTNLLRQTSEAMSAYAGGAQGIVIHPWDEFAKEGKDDFTLRMSLNIYNLLHDEAHFDWVEDPMKGSRIVEALTIQIIEKTWTRIQSLSELTEKEMLDTCLAEIHQTRMKREEAWTSGKEILIGVHAYLNSDESKAKSWGALPNYLGKEYLTVESTLK
jgi:methylmalonyl-CoA mutase